MPDGTIILISIVLGLIFIAAIVGVFAVLSNNRNNVQSLEEANRRLMEMRKEFNSYRVKNE